MMDHATAARTSHHGHVRLQRRVHETRRLLLEAADHLLDVDHALRSGDADRAAVARRQAAAATAAAQRRIDDLDPDVTTTITLP